MIIIINYKQLLSRLDWSLPTSQARSSHVVAIFEEYSGLDLATIPEKLVERIADYILYPETSRQNNLISINRQKTIDKRETSLEKSMIKTSEWVDDSILSSERKPDKNIIAYPKKKIVSRHLEHVPNLVDLVESIRILADQLDNDEYSGIEKFKMKQHLIELRKEQYVLIDQWMQPIVFKKLDHPYDWANKQYSEDTPMRQCRIDLTDPEHCREIMKYYSLLKQNNFMNFVGDMFYIILDYEELVDNALKPLPYLFDMYIWRIDQKSLAWVRHQLIMSYGLKYSEEYLSTIYTKKIPRLIAQAAREKELMPTWAKYRPNMIKRCNRCGNTYPQHHYWWNRNKAASDGWYSICKSCRKSSK